MTRAGLHRETTYRRLLPDRSRDQRRARPCRLPHSACYPKTDDKDVNGRARKARREIIARITYPAASCWATMDAILTFIEVVRWFEVCGNGVQGPPAAAFIQAKTTARILQIDFIGRFRRWPIRIEDSTRVTRLTLTQEWWFSRGDTMKLRPGSCRRRWVRR